jgi:hypothetical protein
VQSGRNSQKFQLLTASIRPMTQCEIQRHANLNYPVIAWNQIAVLQPITLHPQLNFKIYRWLKPVLYRDVRCTLSHSLTQLRPAVPVKTHRDTLTANHTSPQQDDVTSFHLPLLSHHFRLTFEYLHHVFPRRKNSSYKLHKHLLSSCLQGNSIKFSSTSDYSSFPHPVCHSKISSMPRIFIINYTFARYSRQKAKSYLS